MGVYSNLHNLIPRTATIMTKNNLPFHFTNVKEKISGRALLFQPATVLLVASDGVSTDALATQCPTLMTTNQSRRISLCAFKHKA